MNTRALLIAVAILPSGNTVHAWQGTPWAPIDRATILSNAMTMMDSAWSPLNTITNHDSAVSRVYYKGTTYTGELYCNGNLQSWAEFFAAVNTTSGGDTAYGNNCAGFVNVAWQLPSFYSIPAIDSNLGGSYFYALGNLGDAPLVSLLPGDALYTTGHIFLFSHYNADGTLESMEQIPPTARSRTWSWNALQNFRPVRRNMVIGGLALTDRIQTTYSIPALSCPGVSCTPIWTAPIGAQGTIVDGPQNADQFRWWKVQYDDFPTAGWTSEGYLRNLVDQSLVCTNPADITPPEGNLSINSGARFANARSVMLTLQCTDSESGCAWMRFSNDNLTWSPWEPFANFKNWFLGPNLGPESVYVQFADPCGNASGSFSHTVLLQNVTPDLVVSSLKAAPAGAGAAINVTDTIANIGSGGANASTTTYFLSSNSTLDAADIVLGSRSVPPLDAGTSNTALTSISIPATVPAGNYFLFAKANSVAALEDCAYMSPCGGLIESNRNNNQRSALVAVGPDLTISSLKGMVSGATISITDTTLNNGNTSAGPSATSFYLSTDAALGGGDVWLGSRQVASLPPAGFSSAVTSVAIPPGTTPGSYFLIAIADDGNAVVEANENNNIRTATVSIRPDLDISSLSIPAAAVVGASTNITDTTKNSGAVAAGASTTSFYLSTNTVIHSWDVWLGSRSVPSLGVGQLSTATSAITVPAGVPPGAYYVIASANDSRAVVEANYNNNAKYKAITVQSAVLSAK